MINFLQVTEASKGASNPLYASNLSDFPHQPEKTLFEYTGLNNT